MLIKEILSYIEEKVPASLKEDFDNVGLLVGDSGKECSGVLIALDVTEEVLNEAVSKKCNLIIAHHPLIFKGLKSVTADGGVGELVVKCIQNEISVYAIHTNLDNAPFGVSKILIEKLGVKQAKPLFPFEKGLKKMVAFCPKAHVESVRNALFDAGAGYIGDYDCCSYNTEGYGTFRAQEGCNPFVGEKGKLHTEPETRIEVVYEAYKESSVIKALLMAHPYEEVAYDCYSITNKGGSAGLGAVGELSEAVPLEEFLHHVKNILKIPVLKHSKATGMFVKKIAVCGGSGSFLIPDAIRSGVDVFLTADVKYHDFQSCEGKLMLIDGGHYETEQFAKELIYSLMLEKFSNFAILISEHNTNYTRYL